MNVQHGRWGGRFLSCFCFVYLCTTATLIRFFSWSSGRLVRCSSQRSGGGGGHLRRNRKGRLSAHGLDASSEVSSSSCFKRFVFTAPFPPCFGLQRSLHYFWLLSLRSSLPFVRPRTVASRRRRQCKRFLTFKGKQSEAGKHFSFAVFFLSRLSSAQS